MSGGTSSATRCAMLFLILVHPPDHTRRLAPADVHPRPHAPHVRGGRRADRREGPRRRAARRATSCRASARSPRRWRSAARRCARRSRCSSTPGCSRSAAARAAGCSSPPTSCPSSSCASASSMRLGEVAAVLEARRLLEPRVAQLAAVRAERGRLRARWSASIEAMRAARRRAATRAGDEDRFLQLDVQFHLALARAARQPDGRDAHAHAVPPARDRARHGDARAARPRVDDRDPRAHARRACARATSTRSRRSWTSTSASSSARGRRRPRGRSCVHCLTSWYRCPPTSVVRCPDQLRSGRRPRGEDGRPGRAASERARRRRRRRDRAPAARPVKLARPETSRWRTSTCSSRARSSSRASRRSCACCSTSTAPTARRGLHTATFVSGYQGSPLGGFDKELMRLARARRRARACTSRPASTRSSPRPPSTARSSSTNLPGPQLRRRGRRLVRQEPRASTARWTRCATPTSPAPTPTAARSRSSATTRAASPRRCPAPPRRRSPRCTCRRSSRARCRRSSTSACTRSPARARPGLWSALKIVTNVADAAGTAQVWPERVAPVMPTVECDGAPVPPHAQRQPARAGVAGARAHAVRRRAWSSRASTRALNQLNPISRARRATPGSGSSPRARSTTSCVQALRDLGLDQRDLERAGVRLLKVGMLYPLDREALPRLRPRPRRDPRRRGEAPVPRDRAARRALRRRPTRRASSASATSTAPRCSRRVRARRRRDRAAPSPRGSSSASTGDRLDARVERDRGAPRRARARAPLPLARTPFFCSGCPHNTSTANPDDTLLGAGIGCHTMVLLAPEGKGTITGITQMGGEGAQWVGMQPFTDADALRPEPRRRHVPPLRLAGDPLRRRRRAPTSPTSCSTTTPSR